MIWLIGLGCLLSGTILGALLFKLYLSDEAKVRTLEEQLQALSEEHESYKSNVHNHFNSSAQLLGKLTESYRDVFVHMAEGARTLCPDYISSQMSLSGDSRTLLGQGEPATPRWRHRWTTPPAPEPAKSVATRTKTTASIRTPTPNIERKPPTQRPVMPGRFLSYNRAPCMSAPAGSGAFHFSQFQQSGSCMSDYRLTHLKQLEAESIHIIREVAAEFERPVMLYSIGKDSAVMLHLALKAFYPGKLPFPLLHIDTTWKFREMIEFRDNVAKKLGVELLVHINQEGIDAGVGPFTHGSKKHTDIMKTAGLKQALNKYKFDAAFGGARRDEEKSRAKERVYSFRDKNHGWDPKNQRPELWNIYNGKINKGESIRVFPLSNWTELDVWQYIHLNNIDIPSLYFAKERRVVDYEGATIMVDDERIPPRAPQERAHGDGQIPHAGLLPADRRGQIPRHDAAGNHPGNAAGNDIRTPGSPDRQRPGRLDGTEKARRVFLGHIQHVAPIRIDRLRYQRLPCAARTQGFAAPAHLRAASTTARAR